MPLEQFAKLVTNQSKVPDFKPPCFEEDTPVKTESTTPADDTPLKAESVKANVTPSTEKAVNKLTPQVWIASVVGASRSIICREYV